MLSVLALLLGEALLLAGLYLVFPPLVLIAAGAQVVPLALLRYSPSGREVTR